MQNSGNLKVRLGNHDLPYPPAAINYLSALVSHFVSLPRTGSEIWILLSEVLEAAHRSGGITVCGPYKDTAKR